MIVLPKEGLGVRNLTMIAKVTPIKKVVIVWGEVSTQYKPIGCRISM